MLQVGLADWPRHRKIIATPFNENTNALVWTESISQAREMLVSWVKCGRAGTVGLARDTRTLSLNVLSATGFRRSYKFHRVTEVAAPSKIESRSYQEALTIILKNVLLIMVVPPNLLFLPFVPKSWAVIGQATSEFKNYVTEMLNHERSLLKDGKPGTGTLMTSLVRASGIDEKDMKSGGNAKNLTVSEVLGNLFFINFAGHDTTASSLSYALLLLSAHPEVQNWVSEEIGQLTDAERVTYEEAFPRLKRCQAVLVRSLQNLSTQATS